MCRFQNVLLLVLLLAIQSVDGLARRCEATSARCDFVCDCEDCSDEKDCGYHGPAFGCDFEEQDACGWTNAATGGPYSWERRQRGSILPHSGPASDYTTGTSSGWFMGVSAVQTDSPSSALLLSPMINQSAATCRLRFRYFLWDSGESGWGDGVFWVSVRGSTGEGTTVWRPEASSIRAWRKGVAFLGRIPGSFQIELRSRRSWGRPADVAVDQLEFLDCALPVGGAGCGEGGVACHRGGCVEHRQVCDGTDDCGDGTDEESCEEYRICDFEKDLCGWDLRTINPILKWTRTSQMNISTTDPLRGPGRDHSTNTATGHFLYLTKPDPFTTDWSSFQSPVLAPTNSTHPCRMVMYTHQFGPVSGGLSVLVAEEEIYPVWQRGGALGDLWVKAEVEFVINSTFQILFVGAVRDHAYGGIGIDDIMLSSNCRNSTDPMPIVKFPQPPPDPCTTPSKTCDFQADCVAAEDEAQCGDFSLGVSGAGWTDCSVGSQAWELRRDANGSHTEVYLAVGSAAGQQRTEAQTRTPLLGPSGPACTLSFSYSLTGSNPHIGELSLRVIDSILGTQPTLWEFSGRTNQTQGVWLTQEVYVGARDHRFQLEFGSRATVLGDDMTIGVKDVRYVNCHPNYLPSSATDLSCNFEVDMCGWYQDKTDNYDWTLLSGMDHSIGTGRSVVVDLWDLALRGVSGRLLSFPMAPELQDHCLSFYYTLSGPNTGALSVKIIYAEGFEEVLWTRSGSHGNMWHEGHCPVSSQFSNYQLVFEAVRSGFDGRIAIDDVAFVGGACTLPSMCSFEGHSCGYSSTGWPGWVHQSWASARTGPRTDHSLETDSGYYMLISGGVEASPPGGGSTLTSAVRRGVEHTECVYFWFSTGGDKPGVLRVYVQPVSGGGRVEVFSSILSAEEIWRHAMGNISGHGDWQLQFEVEGGAEGSYVAIDDIILLSHSCPPSDSVCDLERGLCGWSNTQSVTFDLLDWELSSAAAETQYPTPPYDHTLGNERGHFLFLPHTLRDPANQRAWLLSAHMPPTKSGCLRFWVHQPAAHDSVLRVLRIAAATQTLLLSVEETDGVWRRYDVNITSDTEYQIVFEGQRGMKSVLALDDIQLSVGLNCGQELTDPETGTGAHADIASIVASVVVMVLFLVTVAALLVFYLRMRERARATASDPAITVAAVSFDNDLYEHNASESSSAVQQRE